MYITVSLSVHTCIIVSMETLILCIKKFGKLFKYLENNFIPFCIDFNCLFYKVSKKIVSNLILKKSFELYKKALVKII